MFDSIIKGVNEKYDLGDKAGALISAILALMTDGASGGFAGFINRFRSAGLGGLADSWVSSGANTPVSNEQLESALGENTLRGISEKVGADYATTVGASGYVIPHIVDDLTPDGEVPGDDDLLSRIGTYSTGVGTSSGAAETFDRIDASAGTTDLADGATVAGVPGIFSETGGENDSPLSWLLPLIILALLMIVGFWFCGGKSEPVATTNGNINVANVNSSENTNAATENTNAAK